MNLSVREIELTDIPYIANYWLQSGTDYMEGMGVDVKKLPKREFWDQMLAEQINTPLEQKQSYATIWLVDGQPIGHCNINKIEFGKQAYMHLHIWEEASRRMGIGAALVKLSLPFFFEKYQLTQLYCEPYALNVAPNKLLVKLGFILEKEYTTTPGFICFEQPVKLWVLPRAIWEDRLK